MGADLKKYFLKYLIMILFCVLCSSTEFLFYNPNITKFPLYYALNNLGN